ncbi:tubulin-like doman-containing protein [Burkholderia perseverans]|uniref:tubulin-like doman-containing protein n=1 Tax=Burkholderia perseverans TaxID=2615214 RepID=UPI001FEDF376|nr:tubulin-like doman-containing protein [Burkholderia perseverans]
MEHNNHLIIGLGGSGGKIIRNLRKILERGRDARGGSASTARFEYLYVDTSSDEMDKRDEWKVLGKDIDLARSQYLINTASNVRPVLDDPASFPGLRDWIEPKSIFDFVKPGIAGAAQRRKLGRLVFAQNATQFVRALEDRMHVLEQSPGRKGAVIHVVCGLAGGTGSGSVVDAVALIRNKYTDPDLHRIVIYALLPEKDSRRVRDVAGFSNYYANGYAALAELNAMAVGKYHPANVLDGSRMNHDIYFNGCYLVSNVNEHNLQFDIESETPRIVSEFIYQKTLNQQWEGLNRAEKGENDIKNFESEDDGGKARAKLFLSFGVERIVVPEEEIKEYLAYGFAEQATRQLMFNNFRQGEGYADEPVQKDWGSEVRKPEVVQQLLVSDAHLMLEAGILDEDAQNAMWKPAREYWKQVVSGLGPEIQADQTLEQTQWSHALNTRLSKIFDETYRRMGGVRKFYEIKGNARLEMARHISRRIEKELFAQWKVGQRSLIQLRLFIDALVISLDERLAVFNEELTKAPATEQTVLARIDALTKEFNDVGFFRQHLTDRRGSLFANVATHYQDLYALRTLVEGQRFAAGLIPFVKDELASLRGHIDALHQYLAAAAEKVHQEQAARLAGKDAVYQQRIFDRGAIESVMKSVIVDEQAQITRTQSVRQSIINLAGTEVDSFDKLARSVSLGSILSTISQASATIVEMAHAEIAKSLAPVLHVNIVERLQKQYDANPSGLKDFVSQLYEKSGTMLQYNKTEVDRTVSNNEGGSRGTEKTIAVFLPECESQKNFHASLTAMFEEQKDPASNTVVATGRLSNEIVIMKVASLMPVRFIEPLALLKRHYDGLLGDRNESFLLHGDGNGKQLPPLFARTATEIAIQARRKPYRLVARLLGMLKGRANRTTGEPEWVLTYESDGLPASKALSGGTWDRVFDGDQPEALQALLEKEVTRRLGADYQHLERKNALLDEFNAFARARLEELGDDTDHPAYQELVRMKVAVREIVGLPAASTEYA